MPRAQFTLKRLLISTALIAVGCLGISVAMRSDADLSGPIWYLYFVLALTAPAWIGAGIGLPFNRWLEGAGLGIVIMVCLWVSLPRVHS